MNRMIIGSCGFIGSNLCHRLLKDYPNDKIVGYDNLSSGKLSFLDDIIDSPNFDQIIGDVKDLPALIDTMRNIDIVYHFASNADISKAMSDPTIDFYNGTLLTQNILEAMRIDNVKKLMYASGSGVYGDNGEKLLNEDHSPMLPNSTYGASKLAGESLISAYCNMFGISAVAFRFANVVGFPQTHGVGFDFFHQLLAHPKYLDILGKSGSQSKAYIYVEDIIDAIINPQFKHEGYLGYYNVSTEDYLTVNEIAEIVENVMGLDNVEHKYHGNDEGGWRGDIPTVRLDSSKIRRDYYWNNNYTSREAMTKSIELMLEEYGKTI